MSKVRHFLITLSAMAAVNAWVEAAGQAQAGPTPAPVGMVPWSPGLWKDRREGFWQNREKDQGAVVFLGDSITQGWDLAKSFSNLKVANRGIGGDTTAGVRFRLKEDVLELNPKAVVLLIGTNDFTLTRRRPDEVAMNIKEMIDGMTLANPKMPIVLCHVMPRGLVKNVFPERIMQLNILLDTLAQGRPNVALCDTYGIFATKEGTVKQDEFPDMLHPNEAGYAKWAKALQPLFDKFKIQP